MGEYANFHGASIKIGTCESMYYLRADQAHLVTRQSGSVDPVGDRLSIRFRFPFPDEDTNAPGDFEEYDRGFLVEGAPVPSDVDHYRLQFRATGNATYLVSLPCPLSGEGIEGVTVHRNGGREGSMIVAQKHQANGELWTVTKCSACGAMWRNDKEAAVELVEALLSDADRTLRDVAGAGDGYYHPIEYRENMHEIARRVLAGYRVGVPANA